MTMDETGTRPATRAQSATSAEPGTRADAKDPLADLLGKVVEVGLTVTERDVLTFAVLTGDFAPHHVDEDYARRTTLGRRIAHGALLIGYASAASSAIGEQTPVHVVSLGYDRIRFIKPVFVGDDIVIRYEVTGFDPAKRRTSARIEFTNGDGQLVAVATHLLQAWSGR
jgi:3-hydroxybutyryl-CoA dehydratase